MGLTPPIRPKGALGLMSLSTMSFNSTASKQPMSGAMQQGSICLNDTLTDASVDTGRVMVREVELPPKTLMCLHIFEVLKRCCISHIVTVSFLYFHKRWREDVPMKHKKFKPMKTMCMDRKTASCWVETKEKGNTMQPTLITTPFIAQSKWRFVQ
jgi:hypothetical protein